MSLVDRLRTRARIRREIPGRKSAVENAPDRIADQLEEAADRIEALEGIVRELIPLTSALLGAVNDPVAMPLYVALGKARAALEDK